MRGHIRKYEGKNGVTWSVYYYTRIGENGNKRYTTRRGFKTKKAAATFLASVSQEINQGTYTDPSQEPFAVFIERWLDYKRDFVRQHTYEIYARTLQLHVMPRLGRLKLHELKPYHLSELYMYLKRKTKLSNRSILQIHGILHDMLDRALKWELVNRNVADMVDAPKAERKKFTVWTTDEVTTFIGSNIAKTSRFYPAFVLALTTGMREGEILALRWHDISIDEEMLHVRHTITRENGEYVFGPPKSESGERDISLPREVVTLLRQHKVAQSQIRLKMGQLYQNHDLVFARVNGNFVSQAFLRQKFKDLIHKLELPDIRFHDLRHTHASLLLELHEDMKTVQERLGHASISITADTYTHVSQKVREHPAQLISAALFHSK